MSATIKPLGGGGSSGTGPTTNPVTPAQGGTGQAGGYTKGQTLVANASGGLDKVGPGANGTQAVYDSTQTDGVKFITTTDNRPMGGTMVLIGDSLLANGISTGGTYPAFTYYQHQRDFMTHFQAKYGYPFLMPVVYRGDVLPLGANAGIGGTFGNFNLARLQADALSQKPTDLLWNSGTNDVKNSYTAADIFANTLAAYHASMRAGVKRFWAFGITPRHNVTGVGLSTPQEAQRLAYNVLLANFSAANPSTFIDLQPDAVLIDQATGLMNVNYSYDGLHLNTNGAYTYANQVMGPRWLGLGGSRLPKAITDAYNVSTNPYGNVLTNFLFTGTSGTVGTAVTGSCPTSWRIEQSIGSQTTLATASIVSGTDVDSNTINKFTLALTSNGTTADTEQVRFQNTADFTTGLVKGGWYVFRAEVSVGAVLTGSNILRSFFFEYDDNTTNGDVVRWFSTRYTDTGDSPNVKDIFPVGADTWLVESWPIYLKGTTGCRLKFYCEIDGTVTGTRTVSVCNMEAVQVLDPRFDYTERVQTFTGTATNAVLFPETTNLVINRGTSLVTPVNLPAVPIVGRVYRIKDGKGDCNFFNITLTPASGTIDGASTFVMNVARSSVEIMYNGTEWSIV